MFIYNHMVSGTGFLKIQIWFWSNQTGPLWHQNYYDVTKALLWTWPIKPCIISTMHGSPLIYLWTPLGNNHIFSNLWLCAACWAHFMCHHNLWPTSVSHLFSSLNSSLGFAGRKYYQKITIPIFRLVLKKISVTGCFPSIFLSLSFLLTFFWLFVIAVCGSISVRELVKYLGSL